MRKVRASLEKSNDKSSTRPLWDGFAVGVKRLLRRGFLGWGVSDPLVIPGGPFDQSASNTPPYGWRLTSDRDVVVYRMSPAFSFGTAGVASAALHAIGDQHKSFVLDFSAVSHIDATGASLVASMMRNEHRRGVAVVIFAAAPRVRDALSERGVDRNIAEYAGGLDEAVRIARIGALEGGDRRRI